MLFILPVCGFNVVSNCLICPVLESVLLAEDSIVPAMDGIIMGLWVLYVKTEMGWCNVVLCVGNLTEIQCQLVTHFLCAINCIVKAHLNDHCVIFCDRYLPWVLFSLILSQFLLVWIHYWISLWTPTRQWTQDARQSACLQFRALKLLLFWVKPNKTDNAKKQLVAQENRMTGNGTLVQNIS